uniref:Retrovirus-related Env polyprotein from transposon gypsy n=1 Tax=Zeugodacus cucurbitae TaxID=28588 RepID=A0A0A1XN32_ZEUCU
MTEAQLIESNNRQVVINTRTQEQINALTSTVNELLKEAKKEKIDTAHLFEILLNRNRIMITEIQNIMLAITLAKIKVVNPVIIDNEGLKSILVGPITDIAITELMEVIHFIIKYPRVKFLCRKVLIFPVVHNGVVLQINENTVVECKSGILAVNNCETTTTSTFCRLTTNTTCALQLHTGGTAHCNTQPSHLNASTIVDDGVIIINDSPTRIAIDETPEKNVSGTYLVTFEDHVFLNGTKYVNRMSRLEKAPGITASPLLNITGHETILSLPYIHRLNNQNLQTIDEIKEELTTVTSRTLAFILGLGVAALISGLAFLWQYKKKTRALHEINLVVKYMATNEDDRVSKGGVVNT